MHVHKIFWLRTAENPSKLEHVCAEALVVQSRSPVENFFKRCELVQYGACLAILAFKIWDIF